MFGRLSQLAQNVQSSFTADESEGSPMKASDNEKTIARLQADLEQAEEQNKSINAAFKKLLKEKEQEIKALKEQVSTSDSSVRDASTADDTTADLELITQLKRKNEEYHMLINQKDETIQMLVADVKEAEDLKEKVEKQERINTEKLMFELAERIKAHENIQRKLEETRHVMTEKDNAIHNMADQMAAQDELLKAKEDSIKKLKRMAAGNEASEDMIVTLQKAVQEKDNKLSQLAELVDKLEVEKKLLDAKLHNRDGLETSKDQTIKSLWIEIEQKDEVIQKISSEKEELVSNIDKKEAELKSKTDMINEKEAVVDDLIIKIRSLEKELNMKHSDIEVSSEGASREIGHLKDQLAELNEILKSKTQTIDMFQKEIEEKESAHSELRQKLVALQKVFEDKDEQLQEVSKSNKKIIKERDEYKEMYESEANEKTTLKKKLDKVGRELSQQLDEEARKTSELMSKLSESEKEKTRMKDELDNIMEDLTNCKGQQAAASSVLDAERNRSFELEKLVEDLRKDLADKSEELEKSKIDATKVAENLRAANEEIDLKNKEIQLQRERFDNELDSFQSTSENEKGNAARLLTELEEVRRQLDSANQERGRFERETLGLKRDLEDREVKLEEVHLKLSKTLHDNSELKEVIVKLEGRVDELNTVEKLNESLKADIAKELENMEEEKQIRLNVEKECEMLKKENDERSLALQEKQSCLESVEGENSQSKEEVMKLGERVKTLLKEKAAMENEKEELKREDENLNMKLSQMKGEYLELSEKVGEMEQSLNHMVEKLNSAELKMNESLHEKEMIEEKLRQADEERAALASQKTNIEMALEEFVKSTESRKKRSGRSSADGSEGARSTPNEGLSGYSTPVSKEGSPRNSAFLDAFQPTLQTQTTVSNLFEGKAISEIFQLVEEERRALEASLASATKEKDALSTRNSDLEDYLELERQKFKQASDEISLLQQNFIQTENDLSQHIHHLKEELSAVQYANEEMELRSRQDLESFENSRNEIEKLENALRHNEDKLADKTLELTRLVESSDQMQTELGNKEEQLEKATKQNKQLKNKLKEMMKERAEREKLEQEKDSRIAELEPLTENLNKSMREVERLETEISERDEKMKFLEQERSNKTAELAMLEERIAELEEGAHKLEEMSAHEVYSANEKATEFERSFRELEDVNKILKEDVDTKAREIDDLGSILAVNKEDLLGTKQLLLQRDEELAMLRSNADIKEQKINELTAELDVERKELKKTKEELDELKFTVSEREEALEALKRETIEKTESLKEIGSELEVLKCQNSKQVEYISKLEEDISDINGELSKTTQELSDLKEINQAKIDEVGLLDKEVAALKRSLTESEDNQARFALENEKKLLQFREDFDKKEKEIIALSDQKDCVESKLKDLEAMLVNKDEGLKDIVNMKNNEIELLGHEKEALNLELSGARKDLTDCQQKLAAAESQLEECALKSRQIEEDMTKKVTVKDEEIAEKVEEIAKLSSECDEKALQIERTQEELKGVHDSLEQVAESKDAQDRELEEKIRDCSLLEKTLDTVKEEKLNLVKDLEAKGGEINDLRQQLASNGETIEKLTEQLMREKQMLKEQKSILEQSKDDSGSQIESLLSKFNEVAREKDDLLRSADSLQLDLENSRSELHSSKEQIDLLTAEKENLVNIIEDIGAKLDESNKEISDNLQKLHDANEANRSLLEEKEQLVDNVVSYEGQIKQLEIEKTEYTQGLLDDAALKESLISTLRTDLQSFKEREEDLCKLVKELEKSLSDTNEKLKVLSEEVVGMEQLKKDLEESNREREQLGTQHESLMEKCSSLENQVERLNKEMERCDNEFDAERDIFAAKISDLTAEFDRLSQKEADSRLELEKIKMESDSKDELIALKSEELEVSKSYTEKLENEEILKLKEEVNDKAKNFEEYKSKVLKKMKSMKEEMKKLNARNEELIEKEAMLSKIESELESQQDQRQRFESMALEMTSELEAIKEERQNLMIQIDIHRQRVLEMENLNTSREENMQNFETEIARYQRLLLDKGEESSAVKEMMHKSMEEVQVLQEKLYKKEEKLKMLQEQLVANEEDFSTSFTEKENSIEELSHKLKQLEESVSEKENIVSEQSKSIKDLEEEAAQLKTINYDLDLELKAVKEERGTLAAEHSQLFEKMNALVAELDRIAAEKVASDDEVVKVKEELAVKTREVSMKNEEIDCLKDEVRRLSEEQEKSSTVGAELLSSSKECLTLGHEKEDLMQKLESSTEEKRCLEMECKEKCSEIELLVEQLQEKSNDVERLKSRDMDFEEAVRPYVEQISELQDAAEKKKKTFDEYKAKAAKRIRALKEENSSLQSVVSELNSKLEDQISKTNESFTSLGKDNELLNSRIEEIQLTLNVSLKEIEHFQSLAEASQSETDDVRGELGRVKQRLSDKEEEILTVKDMMKMTMNEVQSLQEELQNKNGEMKMIEAKEDTLNSTIMSLNEELASVKEEYSNKSRDLTTLQGDLAESRKLVEELNGRLDTKNAELDQLQRMPVTEGSEVIAEGKMTAKEEQHTELEKESEAIKLKLAKAIKRMSTLKKELQGKEEIVKSLESEIGSWKKFSQELKEQNLQLQCEVDKAKERFDCQAEELQRKESFIREMSSKSNSEPRVEDIIIPSSLVSVAAESEGSWGDISATDGGNLDDIERVRVEESVLLGSISSNPVDDAQKEELDTLKKDRDQVSESLKKSNEQLEKAKRKIALLKKADTKRANEIEDFRTALDDLSAKKENEICMLVEKINSMDQHLNEKEEQISSLTQQITSLKNDLEEAMKSKDKTQTKCEDMKRLVEVMAEEKHELDSEMKDMLTEIKDVMDIKNRLLAEIEAANEKLRRREEECFQLRDEVSLKEEKLSANEWKLQEYQSFEQDLSVSMQEKSKLHEELSLSLMKLYEHENMLKTRDNEICELNEEILKMRDCNSAKEDLIAELKTEVLKKEKIIKELPSEEGIAQLHYTIANLEEDLRNRQDEMTNLSISNEDYARALTAEKEVCKQLNQHLSVMQRELEHQLENERSKAEEFDIKFTRVQEELTLSLEKIEKGEGLESLVAQLKQELEKQEKMLVEVNRENARKADELQMLHLKFQEKEEEVDTLRNEIAARVKEAQHLNDSEKSILQATIDELRQNSSEKEEFLSQEIRLLQEKLDNESHEIKTVINEKSRIEYEDLRKSFDERIQTVDELKATVERLNETIEHKDTVLVKLKLKLKQTMKDRDVMKGNLQSEIERLSQEKDVVFNEFQAKTQQTESELAEVAKQFEEAKAEKENIMKEMEEKEKIFSRESDELIKKNSEAFSKVASLEGEMSDLRKMLENKEEVVEKYEWENSEKEDRIRDLERDARFFEDRRAEWEELKKTFEDTIEVKERIMESLQQEINDNQTRKVMDSKLKESELHEFEKKNKELENELKIKEIKIKDTEERFLEANRRILESLGISGEEFHAENGILDAIIEFRVSLENVVQSKETEVQNLTEEIENLNRNSSTLEERLEHFKEEQVTEAKRIMDHLDDKTQWAEDKSLRETVDLVIIERDVYKKERNMLNDDIVLLKDSKDLMEKQLEELQGRYNEVIARPVEEKVSLRQIQELQQPNEFVPVNATENQHQELEEECNKLKNELRNLEEESARKHEMLEKRATEMEHALDLAKLETQQVAADKDNLERQLQILTQESETLNSSTAMPEMQAIVSAKNTAMLELRDNFSEIISDKDSIIASLRVKIDGLQQSLLDGNYKSQEEIDALKNSIKQKDERVTSLTQELAATKGNRDWLQSELNKTITEKDSIGGSIQDQFENISEGLRGDIELFIKDKRAFETEFQLERLQLERAIAEQRREIDHFKKSVSEKDKDIFELNFIVSELRRRVEDAAVILSKEDYYQQLEERIEESHEKVRQANAALRDMQDRVREEKVKFEDLEMKLDSSVREKGEIVLVYEGKIQKLKDDHAKVHQSLKSELHEANQKKFDLKASIENKMGEVTRNYQYEERRLKESFWEERVELTQQIEKLVSEVERLEQEKQETREEVINEVLTNADEKMLKLKSDYKQIISDKDYRIKEFADRIEELQARLDSLTESNTNLSKNLFVLENRNAAVMKELSTVTAAYQEAITKHQSEIDDILMKKGTEFKDLRSQFEEALEEKEKILENLRNKMKLLREEMEEKFQENNLLNSEKEEFLQESIKRDLMYEKLKVSIDSLLTSVFELSRRRGEYQKSGSELEKLEEEEDRRNLDNAEVVVKADEKAAKDVVAKEFEATILQARTIIDDYILNRKGDNETQNIVDEKFSILEAEVVTLKEENVNLKAQLTTFDAKDVSISNVEFEHERQESPKEATEEEFKPMSSFELTTVNEEEPSKMVRSLKEELVSLKSENEALEKTRSEMEATVRRDFDDILQNLREDLQNALNENSSLMHENFMLKNVENEKGNRESIKKTDVICQTDDLQLTDATTFHDNQSRSFGRGSSLEAFVQTDVSFVYQPSEASIRDGGLSDAARMKRYNSSERLPEVVEDTLYSKLSFETLQTFSDSTLDVDSFAGHAKLELRLGEDTEDGDKSVAVADLQSEMENLNAKLQHSKRMILKLKQMTKKYKTELNELQTEKFEQVRVYDEAVSAAKQELEESNLEKLRKDQEIRSLREEVRLLVKEKADFGDAVRTRIDAINADHSNVITELVKKNDQECAQKDEVIRMLYDLKSDNESKIKQLTNELNSTLVECDSLKKKCESTQSKLDEDVSTLANKTKEFEELRDRFQQMELKLMQTEQEQMELADRLKIDKADTTVDNAKFDEEIIASYAEETERTNIELQEAFDLIRSLENDRQDLEKENESRTNKFNSIIDAYNSDLERIKAEKIELEKTMQEMREHVKQAVEEKNSVVEYWKNENSRILEESEKKFNENIEISQRNVEECQVEITSLRGQVDSQIEEIRLLQERVNGAETSARDLSERNDSSEALLTNLNIDLGRALEEKSLLEDKIAFFEHQVDGIQKEHERELQSHQNEVEKANSVIEAQRIALSEKDGAIGVLESEIQAVKDELIKNKKKSKRLRRELETSKKTNQELADAIRIEMESVLSEVQNENASLYSELLSKDKQLQELRIHADQLVHEREEWNSKIKLSGRVESDILAKNSDFGMRFSDNERFSMQINQLNREKEQVVANLESKMAEMKDVYEALAKRKREDDLKAAELKARLDQQLMQVRAKDDSGQRDELERYDFQVKGLKGDIEVLKQEASGLADSSKTMFGQMEKEIVALLTNAKQVEFPPDAVNAESRSMSPIAERWSGNNYELEEAREQIVMLEDSLRTWKERCSELQDQLGQQEMFSGISERRGSQEFLINIDDEGPSIETARSLFGEKSQRLTKYKTSGANFNPRARSFFSTFMSKRRGLLPVRRIFFMAYMLVIHVLAFMALYGFIH